PAAAPHVPSGGFADIRVTRLSSSALDRSPAPRAPHFPTRLTRGRPPVEVAVEASRHFDIRGRVVVVARRLVWVVRPNLHRPRRPRPRREVGEDPTRLPPL